MDLLVTLAGQFTTRAQEISLNGTVLLFTLGIAMATGVLVGAIPALPGRVEPVVGDSGRRTDGLGRPRFAQERAHRRAGGGLVRAAHRRRADAAQRPAAAGSRRRHPDRQRDQHARGAELLEVHDAGAPRAVPDGAGRAAARAAGSPIGRRRRDVSDERRRRLSRRRARRGPARGRGGAAAASRSAVGVPGLLPDRRHSAAARTPSRRPRHRRPRTGRGHQRLDGPAVLPAAPRPWARASRPTTGDRWVRIVGIVGDVAQHARVAAVADVLSSARAGTAADRHVPGADIRRSGRRSSSRCATRCTRSIRTSRSISSGRSTRCARRRSRRRG